MAQVAARDCRHLNRFLNSIDRVLFRSDGSEGFGWGHAGGADSGEEAGDGPDRAAPNRMRHQPLGLAHFGIEMGHPYRRNRAGPNFDLGLRAAVQRRHDRSAGSLPGVRNKREVGLVSISVPCAVRALVCQGCAARARLRAGTRPRVKPPRGPDRGLCGRCAR